MAQPYRIKQRLAIHTHEFFPKHGGIGSYCRELALAAADLGWEVLLYGPAQTERYPHDLSDSYKLENGSYGFSHGAINLWRSRVELATAFRQNNAGIHLLAEPGPILAYGLLPRSMPKPDVRLTLHGSEIERWSKFRFGSRQIAERSFQQAEQIIVPSNPIAERLFATFPATRSKTRIVPHALPRFFEEIATRTRQSAKPRSGNDSIKLLSVGRIHPRKGFDQVLNALKQLPPSVKSSFQYTIVGARSHRGYERELRRLAKLSDCPVHFQFNPEDSVLARCYHAADLFVLTSLPRRSSVEGFGLVYLEAAAFGLPCLAYETGGVGAAIQHGETGILVPPGRPDLLAEELLSFYKNPVPYQVMGTCGQKRSLSRNWNHVVRDSFPDIFKVSSA